MFALLLERVAGFREFAIFAGFAGLLRLPLAGAGRYRCPVCGYVYDEREADQTWDSLPHDWACPGCGAAKSAFEPWGREALPPLRAAFGRAALAHRVLGYVFLALYVLLMWQMVPRLWTHQIELPARTVVHMSLGMALGVILLVKISIVRFFQRLDASLVAGVAATGLMYYLRGRSHGS